MTIIKKPPKTFSNRFVLGLKSFHITLWLYPTILIAIPVFTLLGYRDFNKVTLTTSMVLGFLYAIMLLCFALKHTKNTITKIVIGDDINIEATRFGKKRNLQIKKDKLTYITRNRGGFETSYISFLNDGLVVLSQYTIENYWYWDDIEAIDNKLKQLGFKKPYGENL